MIIHSVKYPAYYLLRRLN